jgi:hypothetical protein
MWYLERNANELPGGRRQVSEEQLLRRVQLKNEQNEGESYEVGR